MSALVQQISMIAGIPSNGALPATFNWAMYSGDDAEFTVTITDNNGSPAILAGATVQFISSISGVAPPWGSVVILALSTDPDGQGQATFALTHANTNPLATSLVKYTIVVADGAGHETSVLRGNGQFTVRGT